MATEQEADEVANDSVRLACSFIHYYCRENLSNGVPLNVQDSEGITAVDLGPASGSENTLNFRHYQNRY